MGKIVFITGGARSGKSSFAMKEASKIHGKRLYIATAEPLDDEMKERIERHKKERPGDWDTVEEPMNIAEVMREAPKEYDVMVLDCLTLWMSNLLIRVHNTEDSTQIIETEIGNLLDTVKMLKNSSLPDSAPSNCSLYIVSNEVGLGIVPDNKLARMFRDYAGMLNQRIAEIADEVYMVLAGIPLRIKG